MSATTDGGRWTPYEDARLLELKAQGLTDAAAGLRLGRPARSVSTRLAKLRRAAKAKGG